MTAKRLGSILAAILIFSCQGFAIDTVVSRGAGISTRQRAEFLQDFIKRLSITNAVSDNKNIRRNAD